MGESKHTPGPWVEDKLDGNVYGRDHSLVAIPHATALRSEFDGRIAANAALISAAPEMYEALDACASMLSEIADSEGTPWFNEGGTLATIKAARSALAKAEGR